MAARSSTVIVQEPFNPVLPPIIDLKAQGKLVYKDNETDAGPDAFDFNTEKFVDFESLKANGIDVQSLFFDQQWKNYFEMLNGFVYYDIVKYFWQKATVFDRACADEEVRKIVAKNKSLQGKTRQQLGLKPYKGKEIRLNILGINILITQEHIAKMLGLDNKGDDVDMYEEKSKHLEAINQDLFMPGCSNRDIGKLKFMKHQFGFAFRVFLASIVTREGGLDTISIQHKHFIWFLYKKVKINLAKTLFEHLCLTITKSRAKSPSNIHHPRLISELIRQTKLTDILSAREKLRVFNTAKYDANVLVNMKKKTKDEIIKVKTPLQAIYEKYFWCDGFPTISEHDNEEVIKNFLEIVRRETGVRMPRKFFVSVPNWDIFKGPKEITRSRKQPRTTEQDIVEEGSQDQEKVDDDETEQGDSGAGGMAAEGKNVAAQKEKRTKKRSDRPVNAEEDQPVRATKRTKTVMKRKAADTLQGNTSKPNTNSTFNAQTSTSQPSKEPSPIDFTKPISVVLPDPKPSSSLSSSDETLSDSSIDSTELIAELDKLEKVKEKKNKPVKKHTKRTTKKPIHIASDEEPPIIIDTSILDQPANTPSVLDHLTQHLSGDAFTHSNPNSPPHFSFINTTANPPIQGLPNQTIQTPPSSLDNISQENPPTFTPVQDETIAHSVEQTQQKSPLHSPVHNMPEQQPPSPPTEIYTPAPSPEPTPELIYGPLNKPLDEEELAELTDFIFKAEEQLLKNAIDIDDEPRLPPNLSKIKIIELKRKKPEPTIPFDPTKPFFNSASEPNLELLNNAISLRFKRFKQMDEEVLVFPSDIDAEVRKMEYLFSQSLRILGTHLKSKIQGRGMAAVINLFDCIERSRAPKLTFYNHVEEQNRLNLLTAIEESLRTASANANALISEEVAYLRFVEAEQARIAAEVESKRLADEEALKLLVDQAVHIAEDIEMSDQNQVGEASDKGKTPIIDTTPPASPKFEPGSPSTPIPPAVQSALDNIKSELAEDIKDEIDVLRIDLRSDLTSAIAASEEATHRRMDTMMQTLLKAISDIKKP
ncbi:hypothetical protein QL285_082273 [Trifolium repens]|nr:hypothetical protein QL285_082273 [Trifolium repens]